MMPMVQISVANVRWSEVVGVHPSVGHGSIRNPINRNQGIHPYPQRHPSNIQSYIFL